MKRNIKYEHELSPFEKYNLDYEKGFRQGKLEGTREILMNVLKLNGEEENYKVSKDLIRKINYETDRGYLSKLIFVMLKDKQSVKYVEENYDRIFRTEEDITAEKYTIYSKYSDDN